MNGRKLGRLGMIAMLPLVCGAAASAQTLDLADQNGAQTQPFADPAHPATMVFEETKHNFGRISDEGQYEHIFKFTNTGTGALVISQAKGSCSCTVPALAKKEYAPGESGDIRVIFDPKSKAGPQHQTITITSNSAEMPMMQLSIEAYVRPEVMVEPRVGHFGEVSKDAEATIELIVTGRSPDFNVESAVASDADNFAVVVGETVELELPIVLDAVDPHAGHDHGAEIPADEQAQLAAQAADIVAETEKVRQCKITVTMKPGQDIGLIRGKTLSITTNDPERPPLQVELMAQHKGDLDLMPRRLTLGALEPGQAFHQEVVIKSTSGAPFKVLGIEHVAVAADALDYSFYPTDPANPTQYTIMVDGEMPADARVLRGRLLVRTDMEREEEVYLYYYGQARPAAKPQGQPATTGAAGN
ncbi:MAG: DUF1573 domain-containing protein [Phycisphaerales bacterium]|nr:DUF1573 domain-containing protein [Phycisphaerales bacterium]